MDVSDKCRVYHECKIARDTRMRGLCFVGCVYVFARMRSFGYQIAKFYMNARMLKMSFYIHVSVIIYYTYAANVPIDYQESDPMI